MRMQTRFLKWDNEKIVSGFSTVHPDAGLHEVFSGAAATRAPRGLPLPLLQARRGHRPGQQRVRLALHRQIGESDWLYIAKSVSYGGSTSSNW